MAETYRSGRFKGLPKFCECGGRMVYQRQSGRVFSSCDTCTPAVRVPRPEGEGER